MKYLGYGKEDRALLASTHVKDESFDMKKKLKSHIQVIPKKIFLYRFCRFCKENLFCDVTATTIMF